MCQGVLHFKLTSLKRGLTLGQIPTPLNGQWKKMLDLLQTASSLSVYSQRARWQPHHKMLVYGSAAKGNTGALNTSPKPSPSVSKSSSRSRTPASNETLIEKTPDDIMHSQQTESHSSPFLHDSALSPSHIEDVGQHVFISEIL